MPDRVRSVARVERWIDNEFEYLAGRSPAAGDRLDRVETAQRLLPEYPLLGRPTEMQDTRRLVVPPYVVTYRVIGFDVVIVDIRHQRQAERPLRKRTANPACLAGFAVSR